MFVTARFNHSMDRPEYMRYNTTALAYMGDAVYEVEIRRRMLGRIPADAHKAHLTAVRYVAAERQAIAARAMLASGFLTDEETALLKRARNHRSMSRPSHADPRDYKLATGFEAVLGYLYLSGDPDRITEIAEEAVRIIDEAD